MLESFSRSLVEGLVEAGLKSFSTCYTKTIQPPTCWNLFLKYLAALFRIFRTAMFLNTIVSYGEIKIFLSEFKTIVLINIKIR